MDAGYDGFRVRLTQQGEEALGRLAQDLLKSPLVSGTLTTAFDVRERAGRAQELAMSALNLPSASDLERLTRRLRSVSQRLEGVEEALQGVSDRLDQPRDESALEARLAKLEKRLAALDRTLAKLDRKLDAGS
jgi:septal ring factor EnvC (AmiA/AmiB activator)